MYKITELIKRHFDNNHIANIVVEKENRDYIVFFYRGNNVKSVRVDIIVEKDEMPTIMVYLEEICNIPENKILFMLSLINKFCAEYKWMQFWINSRFKFNISAQSYVTEENAGNIAEELSFMCANTYDEIYPEILAVLLKEGF